MTREELAKSEKLFDKLVEIGLKLNKYRKTLETDERRRLRKKQQDLRKEYFELTGIAVRSDR